jgi:hypothetical protein
MIKDNNELYPLEKILLVSRSDGIWPEEVSLERFKKLFAKIKKR